MKFLNIMVSLTVMALLLVDCKGDHNNQNDDNDGPPTVVVERPDMAIELGEAIDLYQNYGASRVGLIEAYEEELGEVDGFQATRSLTFDFEELKQYMKYIEQEAKAADTPIKGLRVYLGQYDRKSSHYPNSGTVFFNPTLETADGSEVSFAIKNNNGNPIAIPVGQLQEYLLKGAKTPGKANLILTLQEDDITSLAGNHGGKRPPPSTDDEDYFDENN